MGIISVDLFITLDGVYQGPGGPDEDRSGEFNLGGWQGAYTDAESGEAFGAGIEQMDALLLGRTSYDIFAGYWPALGKSNPIAAKLNALPKFLLSRTRSNPEWEGTTTLQTMDMVAALKSQFHDIHVIGSGKLVRSLLAADLVDRLNFYLYPLTRGSGKQLFADGAGVPEAFNLAQPPKAFPKGAVSLIYERAGVPMTGINMAEMT